MRKLISAACICLSVFSLVACGSKDNSSTNKESGYELALITDAGSIDDKSFNQGSWEGLEKFAEDNNLTKKYYKPADKSTEALKSAIDLAVKGLSLIHI